MSDAKVNITLTDSIGRVADAVTSVANAVSKWLGDSDKRRSAKCIRIGDKMCKRIEFLDVEDTKLRKLVALYDKYNN